MSERSQERDRILEAIEKACRNDPRVAAAWLIGSMGAGAGDDWSDLDVWVVAHEVDDAELLDDLVKAPGEPKLRVSAPQNAPAGGHFLTAAYDAPTGPHLVDWYLQPLAYAAYPRSQRTLILRADLPEFAPPAPPRPHRGVQPRTSDAFWAMMLLQAKALARGAPRLDFEDFLAEYVPAPPETGAAPLERLRAFVSLAPEHPIRPAVERHLDYVGRSIA